MSRCPTFTFRVSIMSKCLSRHISSKFPSKLLLEKDILTLTFVAHENETRISIWEFEMMNVLHNIFAFISARYTSKFKEQK